MKEITLRKWHRSMGIILAFFLFLQGGSGLLLSIENLFELYSSEPITAITGVEHGEHNKTEPVEKTNSAVAAHGQAHDENGILEQVHHKHEPIWNIYRIILGLGLLGTIFTGVTIYMKIQSRSRKPSQKR